jgi:hypothetical protein
MCAGDGAEEEKEEVYCGGVRWPAPEKSPDLGNSSPAPRALMYVASLQTSGQHHHHHEDDRN